MRFIHLTLALALLSGPAFAQDGGNRRAPRQGGGGAGAQGEGRAVPRGGVTRNPQAPPSRPEQDPGRAQDRAGARRANPPDRPRGIDSTRPSAPVDTAEQRRAGPRDRQGGVAVPRGRVARPAPPVTVYRTPRVYNYYYPRNYAGFGYYAPFGYWNGFGGGWGPGLGAGYLYDPWYPPVYSNGNAYGTGQVRLRVTPRSAQVLVNGYYAGIVDNFDGTFQGLRLEPGAYRIEIVSPGYDPLEFDVRVTTGQTITYRGELLPEP